MGRFDGPMRRRPADEQPAMHDTMRSLVRRRVADEQAMARDALGHQWRSLLRWFICRAATHRISTAPFHPYLV
jgi:hypothetical protein